MNKYILFLLLTTGTLSCGKDNNPGPVSNLFFPCYDAEEDGPIQPDSYIGLPEDCNILLVEEDFSNNNANWWEPNETGYEYMVSQGVYQMRSNQNTNYYYTREYGQLEGVENFSVEAEIRFINGPAASNSSITWGGRDGLDNLWRFGVSRDQRFSIRKIVNNSTVETPVPPSLTGAIDPDGFNKLSIRKVGNTHYFFINELLVSTQENLVLFGNEVGFNVAANSEVHWDNFRLTNHY